ncbi:hypothetical protein ISN75_19020 [Dyella marensis]|uniref:hypothetical protein n=1 Tax=Dyella marensis TaxID=500610 RepID=UPI0031E460F5
MTILVFVLGFFAVLIKFPTAEGSTTLAGALFGSGAAFIGTWVAERKKADEDASLKNRRADEAKAFLSPELATIVARQTQILDRISANFVTTSVGSPPLEEPLCTFRPRRPTLFPATADRRDLNSEDAEILVEFYNAIQDIDETIALWERSDTRLDFNAFNVLLQEVAHSLTLARLAVLRFCPDQRYSAVMLASGTLLNVVDRSMEMAASALSAHMKRADPRQPWLASRQGRDAS